MSETYCSKSCAGCGSREGCPGCKMGPGSFRGDCEIASCCRSKGHDECATCSFRTNCGKLRDREQVPGFRELKKKQAREREALLTSRAPLMARWVRVLFWLVVPSLIAGILTLEPVLEVWPALKLPGQLLGLGCSVAYCLILLKLSDVNERYRKAAILGLIGVIASALLPDDGLWVILLLAVSIAAFVGEYNEFQAHAEALEDADTILAQRWRKLWSWCIGMPLGLIACAVLTLIIPLLGALGALICTIGMIVVNILKLAYLYQTAGVFRNLAGRA